MEFFTVNQIILLRMRCFIQQKLTRNVFHWIKSHNIVFNSNKSKKIIYQYKHCLQNQCKTLRNLTLHTYTSSNTFIDICWRFGCGLLHWTISFIEKQNTVVVFLERLIISATKLAVTALFTKLISTLWGIPT